MAKAKPITQLDIHASNAKNAHIIIKTRLDEMYSWDTCVDDPDRMQDLHNLRIAAKRLRYTLEIFETILPEENTSLRKELEQIQEELGAWHDSDVMIAMLQFSLLQYPPTDRWNEENQTSLPMPPDVGNSSGTMPNMSSGFALGSQDRESSNMDVQSATSQELPREKIVFRPALLSRILDPAIAPSAQERQGLNLLLTCLQREHKEQYTAFRNHWYQLKEQDFQRQILDMLDT